LTAVQFLAPWAVCMYAQYALWLREARFNKVSITVDPKSKAGIYAIRTGLTELISPGKYTKLPSDEHMAPLRRISRSVDVTPFADEIIRLLAIGDEEVESAVRYSFIEMVRNAVQHSRSHGGGLAMAQYYSKSEIVEVVVADAGIGIRTSLSQKYPELDTDLKALKLSINPYVSGTFAPGAYASMGDNAGLGLFFIKEIATRAHGGFFLGSYSAVIDYWGNSDDTFSNDYRTTRGQWPGTFVMIQLRKGSIAMYDSLIELIRELANYSELPAEQLLLNFLSELPMDTKPISIVRFDENVEAARKIRDEEIIPALMQGRKVHLDFTGVPAPTQSFMHACLYKPLRDFPDAGKLLFLCRCTEAAKASAKVVASYARMKADLPGYTEP
jgi:anti-sigma regulatory factor (Ser/Thr protein kinase)